MRFKGSLMDYVNMRIEQAKIGNITKQMFGDYMHDDGKTEAEKLAFLEQVEMAGGYENLPD